MTRPLALAVSGATSLDLVRTGAVGLTLGVLTALTLVPVAGVIVGGATGAVALPVWLLLRTLTVGLASTILAIAPAAVVVTTLLRVDVPGRASLWRALALTALIPPFIPPLALLVLVGPQGIVIRGGLPAGLLAVAIGQALMVLPLAIALGVRALAGVRTELEQAAELLGASPLTVFRRVTLALAGPRLLRAGFVLLGICVADVASPLLLGGDHLVLSTAVIAEAEAGRAAPLALRLAALTGAIAIVGAVWREAGFAGIGAPALPRLDRPRRRMVRWVTGAIAWGVAACLVAPVAVVVAASVPSWTELARAGGALGASLLLGLGAAAAGTGLAVATARIVERRLGAARRIALLLARVPAIVPGLVAAVGYATLVGAGVTPGVGALATAIAIVAVWELPVTVRAARAALVPGDRSLEEAAGSLGASAFTTMVRIVVPGLSAVAWRIAAHLFGAGVLAVGAVVALTGLRPGPGTVAMLGLATAGATGAACAIAVALLAIAGAALVLGRAVGARGLDPTMLT